MRGRLEGGRVETIDAGWGNDQPDRRLAAEVGRDRGRAIPPGMHQQADIGQRPTRQRGLHATPFQFSQRHEQAGRDRCGGRSAAGPIEGADDGREGIAHGRVQAHGCV